MGIFPSDDDITADDVTNIDEPATEVDQGQAHRLAGLLNQLSEDLLKIDNHPISTGCR